MASDNSENYDWLFEEVDKKGRNKDESSNDMASSSKGIRICENNLRSDEKGSEGLSEQLGAMGGAKDGGAIVVAVSNKPESESVKPHTTAAIGVSNDDDDDCIILDGDPNKSIEVVNETEDDVIIVGQKGEIACRDFPHPRHLCVKFPFTSTAHELHCVQCFCFICDTRAPCSRWGTGKSFAHHCHSTDDDEHWRVERLRAKGNGYKAPPVVSLPTMPALETRKNNYGNDKTRLINALFCTPEVPMLRPSPDHDHHGAHPPPGFSIPRPSFPSNHYIASARGAARSLSSISNPIRPSFKRAGLAGASPRNNNSHTINNIMNNNNNNRLGSVTQLPTSPSMNWRRALQTTSLGIPNTQGSNRLDLSSHPSSGLGYPNHLSPRAQIRASAFSVWRAPFPPLDPLPGVGNLENLTLPRPGAAIFRPTSNYAAALAGPSEPSSALGANGNGLSSRLGVSLGLGSLETQTRGGLLMDGVDGLGQVSHGGNGLVVSSSEFCSAWVRSILGRGGFESLSSSSPFRRTDSTFPSTNIDGKEFQGQR